MSKYIILDRDGVLNHDSYDYIKSVNELILLPGSLEAVAKLTAANYRIGVATNQSGVARGYYSEYQLDLIHQKLLAEVEMAGGRIEIIKYCPHMPDAGCNCRKPKTGMLEAISEHFGCSLVGLPYVGDRITDIIAANAVGAIPHIILSMMTEKIKLANYPTVPVFASLAECVDKLLES